MAFVFATKNLYADAVAVFAASAASILGTHSAPHGHSRETRPARSNLRSESDTGTFTGTLLQNRAQTLANMSTRTVRQTHTMQQDLAILSKGEKCIKTQF